jgi:hypothetical protein
MSKGMKRKRMCLPQELVVPKKKRTCDIVSKSKSLLIDNKEALMLELTWEEAQDFLHPPPTVNSNIVVIEDHVFEEYEVSKLL